MKTRIEFTNCKIKESIIVPGTFVVGLYLVIYGNTYEVIDETSIIDVNDYDGIHEVLRLIVVKPSRRQLIAIPSRNAPPH